MKSNQDDQCKKASISGSDERDTEQIKYLIAPTTQPTQCYDRKLTVENKKKH